VNAVGVKRGGGGGGENASVDLIGNGKERRGRLTEFCISEKKDNPLQFVVKRGEKFSVGKKGGEENSQ